MNTRALAPERETAPEQLPLGKAIALHLLPGVGLVTLMYVLAPMMDAIRAPRFLAFLLAGIVVIGGWELVYLLRQARRDLRPRRRRLARRTHTSRRGRFRPRER
jgi:hypothetical protein